MRVWGWVVGGGECVFMTLTPSLCSRRSSGPTWRPSPSRSTLSYRTSRACLWCWARHCGSGLNCSPSTRNCVHSVFHQSHSVYPFTTGMIYCCKTFCLHCVVCNHKTLYLLYNYDNMFTTIIMEAWRSRIFPKGDQSRHSVK